MKVEKMTTQIAEIAKINPITKRQINRGYQAEIAYKATKNGFIDYKLDNTKNTIAGDNNKGNYFYQVKAKNCEIKLIKEIKEIATGLENVLNAYIKNNKANRYVYIVENDNTSYAITMNKQEFKQFVLKFGRYSNTRNNIRITRSDKTIFNWATN